MSGGNATERAAPWGFSAVGYLSQLTTPRLVLWCYLIWWAFAAARYFDPQPRVWLSSLGISAIIGTGLYLSTAYGGRTRTVLEPWQIARLYVMPFCVSSFAALIKGHDFVLVFYPSLADNVSAALACAAFVASSGAAKHWRRRQFLGEARSGAGEGRPLRLG